MSEDIDFKLVLPEDLSCSARRRLLSQFKKRLVAVLEAAGFAVPAEQIVARDENSYVSLNLHYESRSAPVASLRPEIKVELNARPPVLPTAALPIATMLDALIQAHGTGLQVECIGVERPLLKKYCPSCAGPEARAGRNRADYDERLVRHLYDVSTIARGREGLALPREHFAAMVAGDAAQFRNQFPEFEEDPAGRCAWPWLPCIRRRMLSSATPFALSTNWCSGRR
jgi:hypothetical protein